MSINWSEACVHRKELAQDQSFSPEMTQVCMTNRWHGRAKMLCTACVSICNLLPTAAIYNFSGVIVWNYRDWLGITPKVWWRIPSVCNRLIISKVFMMYGMFLCLCVDMRREYIWTMGWILEKRKKTLNVKSHDIYTRLFCFVALW